MDRFIGDATWSQPPTSAMPWSALQLLQEPWPSTALPRKPVLPFKAKWSELRAQLQLRFSHQDGFHAAQEYITALIDGTCEVGGVLPDLRWHREIEQALPMPRLMPLALQGAMEPGKKFQATWRI